MVPPFTFGLSFGQNGFFKSWNNNLFDSSGTSQANTPNTNYTWQTWDSACTACKVEGNLICDCPTSADLAQYDAFEAWSGSQYANLDDHVLPYPGNQGGVSGNYVYKLPSNNWTELGPSFGGVADQDDTHATTTSPSTHINFSFGLDYDIVSLDAILGLQFLSAMELTQGQATWNEAVRANTVTTMLDAGTGATLDIKLTLANPFPFGPNPLLSADFSILNQSNASKQTHVTATSLEYNTVDGTPVYEYQTQAVGNENAPAAEAACLAAPAQNGNMTTPKSPQSWVQQVTSAAQGALYPCNIDLCNPSSASSATGTLDKCTWNALTKKITCASTGQACSICQDSIELCSKDPATGVVTTYAPSSPAANSIKGCGVIP